MYSLHVTRNFVSRRLKSNSTYTSPPMYISVFARNAQCRKTKKFQKYSKQLSLWFQEQSIQIIRACTRQFEFIAAQRIRRSMQIFQLYSKIWDEVALKEFMRSWRQRIVRNSRQFLVSAVGVTMYNWDQERISNQEIQSYNKEIENIYKLRDATVVCAKCHLRLVFDVAQPGVKYCECNGSVAVTNLSSNTDNGETEVHWQPFIERQDMLIWRRQEPNFGGLYAYKVYGSFPDVTAKDFLKVQIDVNYRKEWDPTASELEVIDTDPEAESTSEHSTDIIYWEMIWPSLFANRGYVYQRRWRLDKENGVIVIVSRVTDHPNAPKRPGTFRVTTYWSYMVIKPYKEFDKPGIEFGLTYFDDPGVNVPSAVTAWVAMRGLPDFLCRMRQASKDYHKLKATHETIEKLDSECGEEGNEQEEKEEMSNLNLDETSETEEKTSILLKEITSNEKVKDKGDKVDESQRIDETDSSNLPEEPEHQGFLYYFFFTRLFA